MTRRGILSVALLGLAACTSDQVEERIVLITVDTLRWDAFDGEDAVMPRSAEAANGGLSFTNCYSASSSTQPTHATLFTGLHPWQSGVPRNGMVLTPDHRTAAELLADAGWETRAAVASFPLHSLFGWNQGFQTYEDSFEERKSQDDWNDVKLVDGFYNRAQSVTDHALKQIDEARGKKQFFWFHFFDPHAPYGDGQEEPIDFQDLLVACAQRTPDVPELIERAHRFYTEDVESMDAHIGTVLARLAEDADHVRTHIILTADHGESFAEDGSLGHGNRLTRNQIHVPLFILSPDVEPERSEETVGSIDVFPTLLALAGLDAPEGTSGRDLLAEREAGSTGGVAFGMRRTYAERTVEQRADGTRIYVSKRRFFRAEGGEIVSGDRKTLVTESGQTPAGASELKQLFAAFTKELEGQAAEELLDEETQKALEALGYTR